MGIESVLANETEEEICWAFVGNPYIRAVPHFLTPFLSAWNIFFSFKNHFIEA